MILQNHTPIPFLCHLHLAPCTYIMAGFHLPGDPYFPNQGNRGWIQEDPEEDPEVQMEEDTEEQMGDVEDDDDDSDEEDFDAESEVINLPYVAHVPVHRQCYQGPTPSWVDDLQRWSRQQGQHSPYGMERGFYDLSHRGPADRALPIMITQIMLLGERARESSSQMRSLPLGSDDQIRNTTGPMRSLMVFRRISRPHELRPGSTERDTLPLRKG